MAVDFRALFLSKCPTNSGTVLYVDANNGNNGNPGTSASPKQTIDGALSAAGNNGTIYVRNGTYGSLYINGRGGGATNWLRIMADSGHSPKIYAGGGKGIQIDNSNFIGIYGFEVQGDGTAMYGQGCIVGENGLAHHISVWKCYIHDFGQAGLGAGRYYYGIDFCYNIVGPNLSRYYWGSAISFWASRSSGGNIDGNGYSNRCIGNVVYDSLTTNYAAHTDANGITFDENNRVIGAEAGSTTDRFLCAFNLSLSNGGAGIHVIGTDRVDVYFNTVGWNHRDSQAPYWPALGDLDQWAAFDVEFAYNVIRANVASGQVAMAGGNEGYLGADVIFDRNVVTASAAGDGNFFRNSGTIPNPTNTLNKTGTGDGYFVNPTAMLTGGVAAAAPGWKPTVGNNVVYDISGRTQLYNALKDWPDYFGELRPVNGVWSAGFAEIQAGTDVGPTASFNISDTTPEVGQLVAFTDTSTGTPTSWLWDFGDGTTSPVRNATHVWLTPGNKTVTLTVTNAFGSDQHSVVYAVTAAGTDPPVANFTVSAAPKAGFPVQFTDTSTNNPTSWDWDFGDGTVSTEQNPAHVYAAPGTYDVTLTVSNVA